MAIESALPNKNRRTDERVPVEIFLNQYVADHLHRGVTSNLSAYGLHVSRVVPARRYAPPRQGNRFVQLEFALPGTSDTIWARGEVRYDALLGSPTGEGIEDVWVQSTGIRLVAIARGHARLLEDYVHDRKRTRLQHLLQLIRHNRYH